MARFNLFIRERGGVLIGMLSALLVFGSAPWVMAAPEGGAVRAGSAQIVQQGSGTIITQGSQRAVIDWRSFGINANERVQFAQPSSGSATLNRVTGSQVSLILGRMDANGQVVLINPNGIIFGKGSQINVGSLIASTANISNDNFMKGRLIFDQPGRPGASVINSGTITAAEGGLIALVAPHVRNDGLILARLGKVMLGASDTFTIDLYGDGLINLALSEESLRQIKGSQALVEQAGTIDVGAGQAVIVTAQAARGMLDSLINMSGTILADSATQEGGRITLLARGGNTEVSGTLSAQGTSGGKIEVLGDEVKLSSTAGLNADGTYGGGTIHVGGAYQGAAGTYASQSTQVDQGANLSANATTRGDGGQVVVWSDGNTSYSGSISARGGRQSGNGGAVEVSGKGALTFNGLVDAGAVSGKSGTLLLDPADFVIGGSEAYLINRVLRTGTSTTVSAGNDIYLNALIDGRGRYAGGGITLSAGNNINLNDYLITNNGAINLFAAAGTVNLAAGKVVYAGGAPITVRSGGTLANGPYLTSGTLSLISTAGSVNMDYPVESSIGNLVVQAAANVNVNQPIVSLNDGSSVTINAGGNVNVNAQINGTGYLPGGAVALGATGNVNINEHVVTNEGAISIAAGGTVIQKADGVDLYGAPLTKQVRTGSAPISVTTGGDLSLGTLVTAGALNVTSTAGKISIDVPIYETTGNTTISAAGNIDIQQVAANATAGSSLTLVSTGGNINVNAKVGPWDRATGILLPHNSAVPGGFIDLRANGSININSDIASYKDVLLGANDASIKLTADTGTINIANGTKVMSDSGAINVTAYGNLNNGPYINNLGAGVVDQLPTTGYFTAGPLSLASTNGTLTINQIIPDTTGEVTLHGYSGITVNQRIYSNNANITLVSEHGGIKQANDPDPVLGLSGTRYLSDIDAKLGNLTLMAYGNIEPTALRTAGVLTIKSTDGSITGGEVLKSSADSVPSAIDLAGSLGITGFDAHECVGTPIRAISNRGNIDGLFVESPVSLEVIAFGNIINVNANLGTVPSFYAGTDITSNNGFSNSYTLVQKAGRNIQSGAYSSVVFAEEPGVTLADVAYTATSLSLSAGTNPFASFSSSYNIAGVYPYDLKNTWVSQGQGSISAPGLIFVSGEGGLTANATGGIAMTDVHVSYLINPPMGVTFAQLASDPRQAQQPFTLNAGGAITINRIETLGAIALSTTSGNITIANTIGAHVAAKAPAQWIWNPYDNAPASISITTLNGNINMQDARAAGNITVSAYGGNVNFSTAFEGGGAVQVREYSLLGVPLKTYTTPADYASSIPLFNVFRLPIPAPLVPAISPGPTIAGPGAPVIPGALPPGSPGAPGVGSTGIPAAPNEAFEIVSNPETEALRMASNIQLSEIIPAEEEQQEKDKEKKKDIIIIPGGRGMTNPASGR